MVAFSDGKPVFAFPENALAQLPWTTRWSLSFFTTPDLRAVATAASTVHTCPHLSFRAGRGAYRPLDFHPPRIPGLPKVERGPPPERWGFDSGPGPISSSVGLRGRLSG